MSAVADRPVPKVSESGSRVSEFRASAWKRYGQALELARTSRRLTIRELGDKLKIPYQTLHRLESGRPVWRDTLLKVEKWLRRIS